LEVIIVSKSLLDIAREAMKREVHFGNLDGIGGLFLSINRDIRDILVVLLYKFGRLNEHSPTSAGGVKNPPLERLNDIDDKFYKRSWRKKFSSSLTFAERELTEEVFVDHPKHITLDIVRNLVEILK